MDINEAISSLQKIKQDKQVKESDNTTNVFAKGLNKFKDILITAMVDLTKLLLTNEPRVTVKNFPKKDKEMMAHMMNMNKQMEDINSSLRSILTELKSK